MRCLRWLIFLLPIQGCIYLDPELLSEDWMENDPMTDEEYLILLEKEMRPFFKEGAHRNLNPELEIEYEIDP